MKHVLGFVLGILILGLAFAAIYWASQSELGFYVFLIAVISPVAYIIGVSILENCDII